MAQFGTQSILLSIMSFLTSLQSEKILSELKKCGDLECESLMIRAQASQDYMGPDCRYLNFKVGEEVLVYFKLSGKREDLWAGSKGKEFGYFPRGTVKIEDVYVSEEVEVPTKETDFVCLDGGAYTFENEDSILQNSNEETEYPYPDKEVVGPIPIMPEGELLKHTSTSSQKEQGFSSTPANESRETQAILNDFQEVAGKPEMSKNNKEDAFQQDTPKSSWAVSDFGEWFGIGSQEEKGTSEPITETFQEDSFRSRKIALSDENSLKESDGKDESENGEITTGETVLHSTMEAGEHYSMDQESAVESQMKSTEDEDKPKEAGSRSDESGWYENIYSNFIGLNRHVSSDQNGEQSSFAKGTEKSTIDQLYSSASQSQVSGSTNVKQLTEEKHGKGEESQSFLSLSHFTNILSIQSITSKVEDYIRGKKEDQSFKEEIPQSKSNEKVLQDFEETEKKMQGFEIHTRKLPDWKENDAVLSKETFLLSTLRLQHNKENSETVVKDNELVTDNDRTSSLPFAKSQLEQSKEQLLQISKYLNTLEEHSGSKEGQEVFEKETKSNSEDLLKDSYKLFLESAVEITEASPEPEKISTASYDDQQNVCKKGGRLEDTAKDSSEDDGPECDSNCITDSRNNNKVQGSEQLSVVQSDELSSKIHLSDHVQQPHFLVSYKEAVTNIKSNVLTSEKYPSDESQDPLQSFALREECSVISNDREVGLNETISNEHLKCFYQDDINQSQNPLSHGLKLSENKLENSGTIKYANDEEQNNKENENAPSIHKPKSMDISHYDVLVSNQASHTVNEDKFQADLQQNELPILHSSISSQQRHITENQREQEKFSKSAATEMHHNDKAILIEENALIGQILQEQAISYLTYKVSSVEDVKLQKDPEEMAVSQDPIHDNKEIGLHELFSKTEFQISDDGTDSNSNSNRGEHFKTKEFMQKEKRDQKDLLISSDLDIQQPISLSHLEDIEHILEKENYNVYSYYPQGDITIKLSDDLESIEVFQDSSVTSAEPGQQAFSEEREQLPQKQLNLVGNAERENVASHLDVLSSSAIDFQRTIIAYKGHNSGQSIPLFDREEKSVHDQLPCLTSEHDLALDAQHIIKVTDKTMVKKDEVPENHNHLEKSDISEMVAYDEKSRIDKEKQERLEYLNRMGYKSCQNKGIVGTIFSKTSEIFGDVYEANEKLEDNRKSQSIKDTKSDATELHYENPKVGEVVQAGTGWTDRILNEQVIIPLATTYIVPAEEEELQKYPELIPAKQDHTEDWRENNFQAISSKSEFVMSKGMIAKTDISSFKENIKKEEVLGKESQELGDVLTSLVSDSQQSGSLSYEATEKIRKRKSDIVYPHPNQDITIKLLTISETKDILQDSSATSKESDQQAFAEQRVQASQECPSVTGNSETSHFDLVSSADIDVQTALAFHEGHNPGHPVPPTDRQVKSMHEYSAFLSSETEMGSDKTYRSKVKEDPNVEQHEVLPTERHIWSRESENSKKAEVWEERNRMDTEKQERLPSQTRMDLKSFPPKGIVDSMLSKTSWILGDLFTKNIAGDTNESSKNKNLAHKKMEDGKKQTTEYIKSDATEMHYDDTKDEDSSARNDLADHVLEQHATTSPPCDTTPTAEELQVHKEPANGNQAEDQREINLQGVPSETEFLISEDTIVEKDSPNFREHVEQEKVLEKEKQDLRHLFAALDSGKQQSGHLLYHDDTENVLNRHSNILYPHYPNEGIRELTDIAESKESFQDSSVTSPEPSQQAFIKHREQVPQEQPCIDGNSELGNLPSYLELVNSGDIGVQRIRTSPKGLSTGQSISLTDRQDQTMHDSVVHLTSANAFGKEQIGNKKEMPYAEKHEVPSSEHHTQSEEYDTSEKARDGEERNIIDTESQERVDPQDVEDQRAIPMKGVMSIIFSKTSGFLGDMFSRNSEEDTNSGAEYKITDHESNENMEDDRKTARNIESSIVQKKSDLIESTFVKETKHQSTETTDHLVTSNDLKMLTEEPETEQVDTWETLAIDKTEKDEHESEKIFTVTNSALQQNKELITHEIDSEILKTFKELEDLHQKITRVQTAQLKSVCEGNKLKLLQCEQYLENLENAQSDVNTFTLDRSSGEKQDSAAASAAPKVAILNKESRREKMIWLQKLQALLSVIRAQCAAQDARVNAEPDTADDAESSNPIPEKTHDTNTVLGTELRKDSEAQIITALHAKEEEEEHLSTSVSQEDTKKLVSETPVQSSGNIPCHEDESTFWMLQSLNTTEICSIVKHVLAAVATLLQKLMEALPEDLKPGHDLHGFPWEMVFCAAIVGLFTALLFVCRTCQSIKSRLYLGRERQLANKVAELVEDKCSVLENLSLCKQQYEELELSLKDASLVKESSKTTDLEATSEKLNRSNSILQNDIKNLEKELEEEKSKRLQQDDLLAEIQRRIQSLENEAKAIKSQTEEARTTLKVFQINKSRLETSLQNAMDERSHLQESNQQLFQEAEGWGERLIELNEQTKMYELSKKDMEEALNNKESQVKSLTECLLKMKDWGSELGGDNDNEDNSWEEEMKNETENGDYLEDLQKRTVKRLIYAAKLNASLKSLETERNQIYSKLSDEVKAKEELADRIEHLQHEQGSLRSENSHFESEVQKLQQKLKVMTEMYQENELKLHRKLTVEEKDRLQKEEKLSKVDEKINFAAEELNSYRTRAKDLEEELEKSIRSYQSQITSHEKKAHDNWLTARAAERHLNDIRKENAHNRQKLTEAEFKLELLEKDPYVLDVPSAAFGRENSPYGLSPLGRPSSETRAFLSPPTLLEGPLRLSPGLPGGGERALRGAGNHAEYPTTNERAELSYDRTSDHQRPHSDTGSLSPPWEREHKMNVPTSDGQPPTENNLGYEYSGNGSKENLGGVLHASDRHLPPGIEAAGPGFVPPSHLPIRSPLLPMDPRGPFLRRGPPFPPPLHPGMYGPREYFPARDFTGLPHPPPGMRNPFPPWPVPHFSPQRAGFVPPQTAPESRNEPLPDLTHPSNAPSAGNPEMQQKP
ncbi:melanoma inhibitory activity protein 2 isoform X2 [Rhinatrema bivittatum]|uniref:melanoma inhibitory activity protein 2 isoform X2 n=1 Tax=Rhinatrema bivittatum TaxID=194408 RepID=UPI00112BC13A|nr:melanoma inhibitory activity protein 2 isoform X2 [Rhinatrema bivittatum]